MFSPPPQSLPAPVFIGPQSYESIMGGLRNMNANPASVAWGTANKARYVPFVIHSGILVVKLWSYNGTTAAGNTDIGIYDASGTKIVSSGATAQSGTSNLQEFNVTDTYLVPGQYWMAMLSSSTTATVFGHNSVPYAKLLGVQSEAVGAGTLPSTFTLAAADGIIPMIGLSGRTTI